MVATYPEYDRLLSFASVHHALRAEKLLTAAGLAVAAVPTPREVDISCGQCLLFAAACEQAALELLAANRVRWAKLFRRDGVNKTYEKLRDQGGAQI